MRTSASAPHLTIEDAIARVVAEHNWPADGFDHVAATRELLRAGTNLIEGRPVVGIGHRVVHGGMQYARQSESIARSSLRCQS